MLKTLSVMAAVMVCGTAAFAGGNGASSKTGGMLPMPAPSLVIPGNTGSFPTMRPAGVTTALPGNTGGFPTMRPEAVTPVYPGDTGSVPTMRPTVETSVHPGNTGSVPTMRPGALVTSVPVVTPGIRVITEPVPVPVFVPQRPFDPVSRTEAVVAAPDGSGGFARSPLTWETVVLPVK